MINVKFKLNQLGIILSCSAVLASYSAQARESVQTIALQAAKKKQIVRLLQERIHRYEKMTLEEIMQDLHAILEKYQVFLKDHHQLSTSLANGISQIDRGIETITSKKDFLKQLRQGLRSLITADNFMFFLTRNMVGPDFVSFTIGTLGVYPLLMLAFDLGTFPAMLLLSLFTGF